MILKVAIAATKGFLKTIKSHVNEFLNVTANSAKKSSKNTLPH
jgi:hypothetical protein